MQLMRLPETEAELKAALKAAYAAGMSDAVSYIEEQGQLVRSMFDGRHDAIIADLAAGLRRRATLGAE